MRYNSITSFLLLILFSTFGMVQGAVAQEQTNPLVGIRATTPNVAQRNGKKVAVDFTLDMSAMPALNRNMMLEVTPVLQSNSTAQSVELPSFIVSGSTRATMLKRKGREANVVRTRAKGQSYHYTSEVPFELWLKDASLVLYAKKYGCADCALGDGMVNLTKTALVPLYQAQYRFETLVPAGEETKRREESLSALIVFQVGKSELIRSLGNNSAELNRIDAKLRELTTNDNLSVDALSLTGYASPEGTAELNQELSKRRVESIANHLVKTDSRFKGHYTSKAMGADWAGLRAAVQESTLADKQEIIRIIDEVPEAGRTAALQQLSGGSTYAVLLREIYPPLRRTVIAFSFVVKGFDLNEAKEIIKTHPTHLSLAEVNLVANSYPEGSNERYQTWVTAAKAFPMAVEPATNAALIDIKAGRYAQAVRLLEQYKDNAKLWNILGVAYAYNEQYEQARTYLERAAQKGMPDAQYNLDEFNHFMEDNF